MPSTPIPGAWSACKKQEFYLKKGCLTSFEKKCLSLVEICFVTRIICLCCFFSFLLFISKRKVHMEKDGSRSRNKLFLKPTLGTKKKFRSFLLRPPSLQKFYHRLVIKTLQELFSILSHFVCTRDMGRNTYSNIFILPCGRFKVVRSKH